MLIQKTFHLHLMPEAARARLQNLAGYRHELVHVETAACTPEGSAHFVFRLPWGFRADVELVRLPSEHPAQTLFRSRRGNIEVLGVLEYFQIRPSLTEIVLTLDYTIGPVCARWIDQMAHGLDRFLNRELECLERAFAQPPRAADSDPG
ncbi:MAG: hypothetical protein PHQ12_05265 [Chthoniobacteraceae bacterium]|nr:hypothetical protein [Chthoniobacteraceae bacterium]